jgi:hypothetical protein
MLQPENARGLVFRPNLDNWSSTVSVPAPLRLRPLEIGDLLDETFRMYRRHFFLFAGISVILSIPQAVLTGGYLAIFGGLLQQAMSATTTSATSLEGPLLGLGVDLLITLVFVPFSYSAVAYAACEAALGRPVTAGGMVRGVFRRYFQLLGYWLLIVLMFSVGICLFPLWTWITVAWVAVVPVMFVESTGLVTAMGRSWRLVEGRWWRTFFILFLMAIVYYVAQIGLTAFINTAQQLLLLVVSSYLVLTIAAATQTLVNALVNPILQIAIVLIYFDLRVRREALDLFQLAQRVGAPRPAP